MHFLGNLGVDIWLLFAQVVNFALLIWILKKLIYNPVVKRIEKDEATLEAAGALEEELGKREKALDKKEKQVTTRAKNKAESIIKEAEEIASDIKKRASDESTQEKEAVIAQVKQRLSEIEHHGQV